MHVASVILDKLKDFCTTYGGSYALRGEIYGGNIQKFNINPHAGLPLDFAAFNLLNLDTFQYMEPAFCIKFCNDYAIPYVPVIKRDQEITKEVVKYYSEEIEKINGSAFEGVVLKFKDGKSCKIINKSYDSKK